MPPLLAHHHSVSKSRCSLLYVACGSCPLLCVLLLICVPSWASAVSVTVNPTAGADLPTCNLTSPCKTIAYAVHHIHASFVFLSAGVFNESCVEISGFASLVISGAPSPDPTIFDCGRRFPGGTATIGAAFNVTSSAITIIGVTFQNCLNPVGNGGALSASDSSVVVTECSFINCTAASGGAISASGPGSNLILVVQNSTFIGNLASGSCPATAVQPCSSWGGAIAAFEMRNITVTGCKMVANSAQAAVLPASPQANASSSAVAGGGCVSVLFSGNSSGCSVYASDNTFLQCTVNVFSSNDVSVGNGRSLGPSRRMQKALLPPFLTLAQGTAVHYLCTLDCSLGCNCSTFRFSASFSSTTDSRAAM